MVEKILKETLIFPTGKVPKQYANEHQCDTGKEVHVFLYDTPKEPKVTVVDDKKKTHR